MGRISESRPKFVKPWPNIEFVLVEWVFWEENERSKLGKKTL